MIRLRNVTKENWFQCTRLDITKEQKFFFPASPVYWMAECRYMKDWHEFAIYWNDILVGFTVYGLDPDNHEYWIYALLIDQKYQRKGYGKQTMLELIKHIKNIHKIKKIYIGFKENNTAASNLYYSLGFQDTGERYNNEIISVLELK